LFTGLIREIGTVTGDQNHILNIRSSLRPKEGDSIAVNGVCLTVTGVTRDGFRVEAADETRRVVPPEKLKGRVHLEPAMSMGERFEGHIVQGHIDTIGIIRSIEKGKNATEYVIGVDPERIAYLVPKGSVAVDGVSLTVNEVGGEWFRLTIIPHTTGETLFEEYRTGTRVNIETDLFARYIDHILRYRGKKRKAAEWREIDAICMSF
jgi:riboflavin synthase